MHIFLVYLTINWQQSGYNYGLGYIASVLKEKGHTVNYILIQKKSDIPALYKKIKSKDPDIIGFYLTTSQLNNLKEIVTHVKKISKSFVLCGGPHPTLNPECITEIPGLDAIVRGEGEYPMLDLAEALKHKTDYLTIKNFWFKTNDEIIINELRPLIKDLDELPFPDKSSLDYQQEINRRRGIIRFVLSRGCTFECTYCSNKSFTDIYRKTYFRTLGPEKAIKLIELDANKYHFKEIIFDDDTINLDKEWFYDFFTLYKKKFKYPFVCNMRPDIINQDEVKLLKEAGVSAIWMGIEHGNENFRKTILNRNITDNEIIDAFRLVDKYNIKSNPQVMLGLPFENKSLYLDTVRLCRKLPKRKSNHISIYYPYPSTVLGDICLKNNWLPVKKDGFDKKDGGERKHASISYPDFSKEEIQMCANMFSILVRFKFIPLNIPLKLLYYTIILPIEFIPRLATKLVNYFKK